MPFAVGWAPSSTLRWRTGRDGRRRVAGRGCAPRWATVIGLAHPVSVTMACTCGVPSPSSIILQPRAVFQQRRFFFLLCRNCMRRPPTPPSTHTAPATPGPGVLYTPALLRQHCHSLKGALWGGAALPLCRLDGRSACQRQRCDLRSLNVISSWAQSQYHCTFVLP